ncbi:MAG: DUF1501 domain-containing protein, partial [Verrucomicrobia bacterium]|nr:DUF1501 domain-containing protein [Verrucomicrobiota bacterium]
MKRPHNTFCGRVDRREFMRNIGGGFTSVALTGMLTKEGFFNQANAAVPDSYANPLAPKEPMLPAKAKSVIFLFMYGGPSHMDTFD